MNKEDILAAARENGTGIGEYEKETLLRGDNLSAVIGMLLGMILFVVEWIVKGKINVGIAAMLFTISATQSIYEGIKLQKKICVIVGGFMAILALVSLVLFALMMVVA